MPCSKCKQKGHHHLHCKSKYTQLSPEENEAIVIANAINNLNQVTKATENKVFKKQLQNQLKALSESLVTHVKQQVENDPLKNPAPLVKRIYNQYGNT
ncbi:unnamed protein product [Ambrosiozyma monospora]|uniref:Unnamed protein product n=1 Tax=Ambrosiozyma monospora TaxID=43982 RepID=A0A9W6Z2H8_AMBMO|nr:unnamed protein product [Ambrosiozyma monospora]